MADLTQYSFICGPPSHAKTVRINRLCADEAEALALAERMFETHPGCLGNGQCQQISVCGPDFTLVGIVERGERQPKPERCAGLEAMPERS